MRGLDWGGWFVTVVDEHTRHVEQVPIAGAQDLASQRLATAGVPMT